MAHPRPTVAELPFLLKAQEALKAAKLSLEHDCPNSAANRAYYAVFHAAREALVRAGVSSLDQPWTHEGIGSGFTLLCHRRKLYPADMLADLALLHTIRLVADYTAEPVSSREATKVVKKAEMFVLRVAREIAP